MYATLKDFYRATLEAAKAYPAEREKLKAINAVAEQYGLEAGTAAFTNWQQKQTPNALPENGKVNKQDATLDKACEFLQNALRKGPRLAGEVTQDALDAGISLKTLTRARRKLNVSSIQGKNILERLWLLPGVSDISITKPEQGSLLDTVTAENHASSPANSLDDASRLKDWLLNYCTRKKTDRIAWCIVRKCSPLRKQSRVHSAFNCLKDQGVAWGEKQGNRIFVRVNPDLLQHQRPRKATLFLETESDVQNATCPPDKERVFFHDKEVTGLALIVKKDGTRTYVFEKSVRGRKKSLTIGDATHWTLEAARAQAKKLTILAYQGVDLKTVKSSVKPSVAPVTPESGDVPVADKDCQSVTDNSNQPGIEMPVTTPPETEAEKAVYRILEACFRQMAEFFQEKTTK